ncbi:hypothetical protein BGZ97_008589, partial [Linnemannia gamsii]
MFTYVFPLTASVTTIAIFAYGLYGKANPYLMPTSSPRSNPCTRSVRHVGTSFLTLLWLISAINYALVIAWVERVFSALSVVITILIVVESISSSRLGKEQRRILKEEERRLDLLRVTTSSGSTLVGTTTDFRKNKKHNNGSRDSGLGSLHSDDSSSNGGRSGEDSMLTGVEIVRPEAIDPATIIYNQQVLFESAQRHYHQQYQQYLLHQPREGGITGSNGDGEQHEGKYDDILLESSYKFEIPMDEPVYRSGALGAASSSSTHLAGPSPSSSSSSPSNKEKMHLPSAPPAPTHSSSQTYPSPAKDPQGPATIHASSSSLSSKTNKQQQRTSLLKSEISPVGIQIMTDTNPFREQDYQAATELSASAPPYEPSSTPSSSLSSSLAAPNFEEHRSLSRNNDSNSRTIMTTAATRSG